MPVHDWSKVSPNLFHHFHSAWLAEISKSLNQRVLPEDYFALLEQSAGQAVPDVIALHSPVPEGQQRPDVGGPEAVAVAERPPQVDLMTMKAAGNFASRQKRIVIRHSEGDVVALIELVSPSNKSTFQRVEDFCQKIDSALADGVHVLVLDILMPRKHDPQGMHGIIWDLLEGEPFKVPSHQSLLLTSYEVCGGIEAYVKPLAVGDVLPPMPLFLRCGWYVEVPLEESYAATWEGAPRQWQGELPTISE